MVAYLKQVPVGFPGAITRPDESNVEPCALVAIGSSPPVYPPGFGFPLVLAAGGGGFQAWGTGNVATDFQGVLVRDVPSIAGSSANDGVFDPVIINPAQIAGLLVRGYINVKCQYGTPARGGIVYVNIQATGSRVVGGFEATSEPSFNVALTNTQAEWAVDGLDAFMNSEIRIAR